MSSSFADKTFSKESSSSGFGGCLFVCFFNISCFLSLKLRSCFPIVSSPKSVVWLAVDKFLKTSRLFETGHDGSVIKLVSRDGGCRNVGGGGGEGGG